MIGFFFNVKQKAYFYFGPGLFCANCSKKIERIIVINKKYGTHTFIIKQYCLKCMDKIRLTGKVEELFSAVIVDKLPPNSFPVILTPVQLRKTNTDIYEAAELESEKTIYRNKHKNIMKDPNFERIQEQNRKQTEDLNQDIKTNKDVLLYLGKYAGAIPIETIERKQLTTPKEQGEDETNY